MSTNFRSNKLGYPASRIRSESVCSILHQDICEPLLCRGWSVSAFRMSWPSTTEEQAQGIWDDILIVRNHLDKQAQLIPGALFIASAVHGTKVKTRTKDYKVNPGVAYWIISNTPITNKVHSYMNGNPYCAVVKFLLQPFQIADINTVSGVLLAALKDTMEGCVPGLLLQNCLKLYGEQKSSEPVCKMYVSSDGPHDILETAVQKLHRESFPTYLETF